MSKKRGKTTKHVVVKPIILNDLNSRCQVNLINMQSQPGGDYRFILVYQDHLTKFVQLRPLKMNRAEDVAHQLGHIFSIFGAPHILHTDNGREFENKLIHEIISLWPGCKLVHRKPGHSQTQGSVERANRDFEDKLKCWMGDNATAKWSDGLPFVQFAKNRCLHSGIGWSPYKAMFGVEPKLGLSTTVLTPSAIDQIDTEENLMQALSDGDSGSSQVEAGNSNEVDESGDANGNIGPEFGVEPSDDNGGLVCVSCDQPAHGAHTCLVCQLSCHLICGIVSGDEMEEGYGQKVTCFVCQRGQSSNQERQSAKRSMVAQADKMKQASDKRFKVAEVGESVSVPIPDLDHGRADHWNLIGVVLEADNGFYKISTKHGILKSLYTRGQFELCNEKFLAIEDVPERETSVREASTSASIGTGQGFQKCSCTTKCVTNHCACRKAGKLCNSKCHGSNSCTNK